MASTNIYQDIDRAKRKNEYRASTLKGVRNLSRSDLETIELYAETIDRTGGYSFLREPVGSVREVLEKYGFIDKEEKVC